MIFFHQRITNICIINIILVHIELEDDFILIRNILTQKKIFLIFFLLSTYQVNEFIVVISYINDILIPNCGPKIS